MSFQLALHAQIIETMKRYLVTVRPYPEIRHQLDIGYEIQDQSVVLHEIRPVWNNPAIIQNLPYAKATYLKSKNTWKVFWLRSDRKWHSYDPMPIVERLEDFLKIVDEDEYACFKG